MTERPGFDWIIPAPQAAQGCCDFLRETMAASGLRRVVIGLSGGIDSAVSAGLAVRALGAENVHGVYLPYRTSAPESLADAQAVAAKLGITSELREITPMADAFLADVPADAAVRRGNVMARCRMIVLYDVSARERALVLGTGNRTETLLGYATLHGDAAFALNPLGDLYKEEVRALARFLELPAAVLDKSPSADLWEGQTDEDELGYSYADADRVLHFMIDEGLGDAQLRSLGFSAALLADVRARVRAQAFKWLPVPYARVLDRPMPDAAWLARKD
ncbi:MAG TPA: NAD+ synthase [Candidatus Krumholzibacteria bacterium]|nr:NAD+ synthase [Candidatus Krumholzibacteria bacterium]HRX52366.1 NAD+ synthase [Candidatus Krumholzibacteria bacterium]